MGGPGSGRRRGPKVANAELEAVRRVFEEVAARMEPHGQVVRPLDVVAALNADAADGDRLWNLARVRVIMNSEGARAWWTPSRRAAASQEGKRVRAGRSRERRLAQAAQDIPPSPPLPEGPAGTNAPLSPSEEHDEYFGAIDATLDMLADYLRIAERRLRADALPLAWANVALQRKLEAAERLLGHYRALGEAALLELETAS